MSVDTLDDVIEDLLDLLGVYGAHEEEHDEPMACRPCGYSYLRRRILEAVEVDRKLAQP